MSLGSGVISSPAASKQASLQTTNSLKLKSKQHKFNMSSAQTQKFLCIFLVLALVACVFVSESMAAKNKGDDIILYNGNIVLRGSGKKGKGGGSIVVANSPQMDMMPFMGGFDGFGRRR